MANQTIDVLRQIIDADVLDLQEEVLALAKAWESADAAISVLVNLPTDDPAANVRHLNKTLVALDEFLSKEEIVRDNAASIDTSTGRIKRLLEGLIAK